ncbi:MAG TPA: carboxyltransferase domain-containing protein, partial [Thiobacillus sp.]|nr:carboxyltransferase domain-containing protein [Thiobacillus sp.]
MEKFTRGQSQINPAWRWISERGLQVMTGDTTLSRYKALTSLNLPEIEDIIPADGSLFLVFRRGEALSADLRAALAAPLADTRGIAGALHEIAVDYGGAAGPDLPTLAEQAGMDVATYINSHAGV